MVDRYGSHARRIPYSSEAGHPLPIGGPHTLGELVAAGRGSALGDSRSRVGHYAPGLAHRALNAGFRGAPPVRDVECDAQFLDVDAGRVAEWHRHGTAVAAIGPCQDGQ